MLGIRTERGVCHSAPCALMFSCVCEIPCRAGKELGLHAPPPPAPPKDLTTLPRPAMAVLTVFEAEAREDGRYLVRGSCVLAKRVKRGAL